MDVRPFDRADPADMELLRPLDVAVRMGVSLATVYTWIRAGELPAFELTPVRPKTRIRGGALRKFAEKRAIAARLKADAK